MYVYMYIIDFGNDFVLIQKYSKYNNSVKLFKNWIFSPKVKWKKKSMMISSKNWDILIPMKMAESSVLCVKYNMQNRVVIITFFQFNRLIEEINCNYITGWNKYSKLIKILIIKIIQNKKLPMKIPLFSFKL